MDKFSFIALWDVYRGLLTPTQRELTDMYFNLDLTLSEIAEQKGITRQAVSECLKTCKKQLEEYEEKLHVREKLDEVSLRYSYILNGARTWAEDLRSSRPGLEKELDGLLAILNK